MELVWHKEALLGTVILLQKCKRYKISRKFYAKLLSKLSKNFTGINVPLFKLAANKYNILEQKEIFAKTLHNNKESIKINRTTVTKTIQ